MRVWACALAAGAAVPAFGQWVAAPPLAVPWFLSEAPRMALAPALAVESRVSHKPPELRGKRVLIERHYLSGKAHVGAVPPFARRTEDGEFDQILREFHFVDAAGEAAGAGLKEVPREPAKTPPEPLAKDPANSTGGANDDLLNALNAKRPPPPSPRSAEEKPNGVGNQSNYPPETNGGFESLSAGKPGDALAIAAAPVTGSARSRAGGTPLAGMDLRFVHHAATGKRHADQACRTDAKGEFATRLEPGLWSVLLVLPDGEGFEKLGFAKVLSKGANRISLE